MRSEICILLTLTCVAHAYKILVVFPAVAHSHYTIGYTLCQALAERGHEVTFITILEKDKEPVNNLKIVILKDMKKGIEGNIQVYKINLI